MLTKSVETNKALESKGITGEKLAESVKTDSRTETDNKSGEGVVQYCERDNTPNEFNPDGLTLKEQLKEAFDTAVSKEGRYVYVGRFTQSFVDKLEKYIQIKKFPIVMNYRDAYLSMESKDKGKYQGDNINYHNLGVDGLESALKSFDSPEYVLLSTKANKIELILKGKDYKNRQLFSIVEVNTKAHNKEGFLDAHVITSVYGKSNLIKRIGTAYEEGRLIYNKENEEISQGIPQVQYKGNINDNSPFNNSILDSDEKVKKKVTDVQNSDRDYLSAVESGNMDAVQRMVDEKAKVSGAKLLPNGNVQHFYHGTRASFTSFSTEKAKSGNYGYGFYFSPEKSKATGYGDNIKDVYIMTDNFATEQSHKISLEQVTEFAKLYGIEEQILFRADSIEEWMSFKNDLSILNDLQFFVNVSSTEVNKEQLLRDLRSTFDYDGLQHANETILWSNTLVKLADPITYDDNGDIIPLSQRFDTEKDDIRYSDRDSEGRTLSEEQMEFFKDSVVRDKDGNLLVMYRGDTEEFTVFERKRSKLSNLYGRGFYFTSSKTHAGQYGKAREFYLDIKNPLSPEQNVITKKQMLDFLKAIENDGEDYDLYNYGEGATAESVLNSVWGKGDFEMLQDVSASAVGDLVAAVELFNEVNGTNYDGIIVPTETVTFKSEQAKLTSNKTPTNNDNVQYAEREIIGVSGTSYGMGVYLDSNLLTGLTDDERISMVKEYVKELGGKDFTAYDINGEAVSIHIAEHHQRFKNSKGNKKRVNTDLNSYLNNKTKQEAVVLVDELITNASYDTSSKPKYPHDWLDGYGKNPWEYWKVFIQEKNKTVWEATLNIANTSNGEKILYDIYPIKMVEQSVTSDTASTKGIITQGNSKSQAQNSNNQNENSNIQNSDRDYLSAVESGNMDAHEVG